MINPLFHLENVYLNIFHLTVFRLKKRFSKNKYVYFFHNIFSSNDLELRKLYCGIIHKSFKKHLLMYKNHRIKVVVYIYLYLFSYKKILNLLI